MLGGHGRSESPSGRPLAALRRQRRVVRRHVGRAGPGFRDAGDTGEELAADPSWVIVAPPDFAPTIGNVVTLHDVVEQAASDAGRLPLPAKVSFEQDILPLLERAATIPVGRRHAPTAATGAATRTRRTTPRPWNGAGTSSTRRCWNCSADPAGGEAAEDARRRALQAHPRSAAMDEHADPSQLSGSGRGSRRQRRSCRRCPATRSTARKGSRPLAAVTPLQYRRLELWADGGFRAGAASPPAGSGRSIGGLPSPRPPSSTGPRWRTASAAGSSPGSRSASFIAARPPLHGTAGTGTGSTTRGLLRRRSDRADGRAVAGRLRRVRGLLVAGAATRPRRHRRGLRGVVIGPLGDDAAWSVRRHPGLPAPPVGARHRGRAAVVERSSDLEKSGGATGHGRPAGAGWVSSSRARHRRAKVWTESRARPLLRAAGSRLLPQHAQPRRPPRASARSRGSWRRVPRRSPATRWSSTGARQRAGLFAYDETTSRPGSTASTSTSWTRSRRTTPTRTRSSAPTRTSSSASGSSPR